MLTFVCLNNIRQICGFPTSAHHMAQSRCRLTHRWKLRTHLDLACFGFSRLWRVLTHLTVCEMPFSLLLGRGVKVCVYENIPLTVWSPLLTGHNFCQLVNLVAWWGYSIWRTNQKRWGGKCFEAKCNPETQYVANRIYLYFYLDIS